MKDISIPIAPTTFLENVKPLSLFENEDLIFFEEKSLEIKKVFEKTWMWRTDGQKRGIINDSQFPTVHGKFQQAILEQKVQLDQTLVLGKSFEETKLDQEDLQYQIEEQMEKYDNETNEIAKKRIDVAIRKLKLNLQYKSYELESQKNAFTYRMKEVKGWENIKDKLKEIMTSQGISEEDMYNKEAGEVTNAFFSYLNKYTDLGNSTDGAEIHNLTSLAIFGIQQAQDYGILDSLMRRCNAKQKAALTKLGVVEEKNKRTL